MDKPASQRGWRVLLGSLLLLLASYVVYFIRYPIWRWTVEPIIASLALSYLAVCIIALVLLKKDLHKPLSAVFRFHGWRPIALGLGLVLLFEALWYSITVLMGSKLEMLPFPNLRGYEAYSYSSLWFAFVLYLLFSVFGSFAEEVAYRGYVQTRVSARYGIVVGILVSAVFFSLQHIHIFQFPWLLGFFEGQFVNVLLGGLVSGYFFYKTQGDIWSVFAFHALGNVFNVSLPLQITYASTYTYYISTIASYGVLFIVIWFLPLSKSKEAGAV